MIDSENLLRDDHAALRRALRISAIGAELMLVGGGEREMLAQTFLLAATPALRRNNALGPSFSTPQAG
jgi:hypothetical protein